MKIKISVVCVAAVLFLVNFSFAGDLPAPIFSTLQPTKKEVVVEYVYFFDVMEYSPHVELKIVSDRNKALYDNPENAAISFLSAMYNKDYEWWINSWDKNSAEMITNKNKAEKRSSDFWIKVWSNAFIDKLIVLTRRVEVDSYVIIAYSVMHKSKELAKNIDREVVLKEEDGRWVVTQELMSDPVLIGWKDPSKRLRKSGKRKPENLEEIKKLFIKN